MSLCIRTIPNKFTPFVNARKKVTRLELKSTFLEEFLGKKITVSRVESYRNKPLDLSIESLLDTRQSIQLLRKCGFVYNGKFKSNTKNVRYIHPRNRETICDDSKVHATQTDLAEQTKATPNDRPSQEQLQAIFKTLEHDLPKLFVQALDYTIYDKNIIFENNIRGVISRDLLGYIRQVSFLKVTGHFKFAYVKFNVMKMTIDPEDDSIKVRWQMHGITTMRVIFKFWKFKPWDRKEISKFKQVWHDGFSTFYVNGNGKVSRHVADKMIPDQNKAQEKVKPSLVSKLALIIGLSKAKFSNLLDSNFSYKLPLTKTCRV